MPSKERRKGAYVAKVWYIELVKNQRAYRRANIQTRRKMEKRALRYAALCIHAPWRGSFGALQKGKLIPALPTAQTFIRTRIRNRPSEWGNSPKSKFARALCGAFTQDDSCRDTLMTRYFPNAKVSTVGQWALWLHVAYPMRHPKETNALFGSVSPIVLEHCKVLIWVRTGERKVLK